MFYYLAQTDTTLRSLAASPLILAAIAAFTILTCGYSLWRGLFDQLQLPISQRRTGFLWLPYGAIFIAIIFELAAIFTIVGLSFSFTLTVSVPLSLLLALLIWNRFIVKVLAQLPGPTERRP
jgi:hypothetical protein